MRSDFKIAQSAITCSKLITETLEEGLKYMFKVNNNGTLLKLLTLRREMLSGSCSKEIVMYNNFLQEFELFILLLYLTSFIYFHNLFFSLYFYFYENNKKTHKLFSFSKN